MFVWSSSYIYCMKKTRFFYEINYFLIVLLGWLLLFHKAAEVNRAREKEDWKTYMKEFVKQILDVCWELPGREGLRAE